MPLNSNSANVTPTQNYKKNHVFEPNNGIVQSFKLERGKSSPFLVKNPLNSLGITTDPPPAKEPCNKIQHDNANFFTNKRLSLDIISRSPNGLVPLQGFSDQIHQNNNPPKCSPPNQRNSQSVPPIRKYSNMLTPVESNQFSRIAQSIISNNPHSAKEIRGPPIFDPRINDEQRRKNSLKQIPSYSQTLAYDYVVTQSVPVIQPKYKIIEDTNENQYRLFSKRMNGQIEKVPSHRNVSVSPGMKNYKPYSLKDYKEIKNQVPQNSRGLGPNINNEDWQKRKEKLERITQFSENVRVFNSQLIIPVFHNKATSEQTKERWKSKREIALAFAKNIPKPKPQKINGESPPRKNRSYDHIEPEFEEKMIENELQELDRKHKLYANQVEKLKLNN